jgi:hypothetical protein
MLSALVFSTQPKCKKTLFLSFAARLIHSLSLTHSSEQNSTLSHLFLDSTQAERTDPSNPSLPFFDILNGAKSCNSLSFTTGLLASSFVMLLIRPRLSLFSPGFTDQPAISILIPFIIRSFLTGSGSPQIDAESPVRHHVA